jgi:hypothetical protein
MPDEEFAGQCIACLHEIKLRLFEGEANRGKPVQPLRRKVNKGGKIEVQRSEIFVGIQSGRSDLSLSKPRVRLALMQERSH